MLVVIILLAIFVNIGFYVVSVGVNNWGKTKKSKDEQ